MKRVEEKATQFQTTINNSSFTPVHTKIGDTDMVVNPNLGNDFAEQYMIPEYEDQFRHENEMENETRREWWENTRGKIQKEYREDSSHLREISEIREKKHKDRVVVAQDGTMIVLRFVNGEWTPIATSRMEESGGWGSWQSIKGGYKFLKDLADGAVSLGKQVVDVSTKAAPLLAAGWLYLSPEYKEAIQGRLTKIGEKAGFDLTGKIQGALGQEKSFVEQVTDQTRATTSDVVELTKTGKEALNTAKSVLEFGREVYDFYKVAKTTFR